MSFEITATTNIDSKSSFAGVEKHVQHIKGVNHSNKDIDEGRTRFNRQINVANETRILKEQYSKFIKEHDKKAVKQGNASSQYKTLEGMLKKHKGNYDARMISTIGRDENYFQIRDELMQRYYNNKVTPDMSSQERSRLKDKAKKIIAKSYADGFESYARGFNKRNNGKITLIKGFVHLDEAGAPHMHSQAIPRGHTKTGKPSFAISAALKEEFNTNDRHEAMRLWRDQEDKALISNMNKSFKKNLGTSYDFTLTRTGNVQNVSMETYKDTKEAYKNIKKAQDNLKLKQARQNKINKEREEKIDKKQKALIKKENEIKAHELNVVTREKALEKKNNKLIELFKKCYKVFAPHATDETLNNLASSENNFVYLMDVINKTTTSHFQHEVRKLSDRRLQERNKKNQRTRTNKKDNEKDTGMSL